ncbi:MAG: DUF4197 domain-containing protein [Gammaproteobacteria bacterium]
MRHPESRFSLLAALVGPTVVLGLLLVTTAAHADWKDWLNKAKEAAPAIVGDQTDSKSVGGGLASLTQGETAKALKQALEKGAGRAIESLGAVDGYLGNAKVRIPLPEEMGTLRKGLALVGRESLADDFETTLNRAAEKAVHEATPVFSKAITNMSFEDAKQILQGGDTAATDYLRRTTHSDLSTRMRPLVEEATDAVDLTSYYKRFASAARDQASRFGGLGSLLGKGETQAEDLDGYVTQRALDGLYTMMAAEEKKIRDNPAQWTTDNLKKVFGSLTR